MTFDRGKKGFFVLTVRQRPNEKEGWKMARKEKVTRVIDGEKRVKRTNPAPLRMS